MFFVKAEILIESLLVSYPSAKASELPDSTTILYPFHPKSCPLAFGQVGYGGIDLHRRIFGSHRSYCQ